MYKSLYALIASLSLVACSHQAAPFTTPDSLGGNVLDLYFQQGEVDIRVIADIDTSWQERTWMNDSLTIPSDMDLTKGSRSKNLTELSYEKISATEATLTYASNSDSGLYPIKYTLKLTFDSPSTGMAEGTGNDYEWQMRCEDVPFEIRKK